jgi:hypothetical protein
MECPRAKSKVHCLEPQRADRRVCPRGQPKAFDLAIGTVSRMVVAMALPMDR